MDAYYQSLKKNWSEVIAVYKNTDMTSLSPRHYYLRGMAYSKLGKNEQAKQYLTEFLKQEKLTVEAYLAETALKGL